MFAFYIISIILMGYYVYLMRKYQYYWRSIPFFSIPNDFVPKTKITVVIPARNEAENIADCLRSVYNQDYPTHLFEIILVNDHSEDDTLKIAMSLPYDNLKIINLEDLTLDANLQSYKKKGIEIAIERATGDLILTTDGDCVVSEQWLSFIAAFYQEKQFKFIAAPVNFYKENSLLERFQSLDFIGMMGVTGAGISGAFMRMCNGANLAYERKVFYEVGGFKGIDGLASGDDMLLMQKVARQFPDAIGYLKNPLARTLTKAQPDLERFISQRVRWASKSSAYPEWQVTFMLAMVFLFSWSILVALFLIPFGGWHMLVFFLGLFLVKSCVDYFFLGEMASFFNRKDLMKTFWRAQVMHIVYIAFIGVLANVQKNYKWKGRKVR